MFANTQMLGLDSGFPDAALAPAPASASKSGPAPMGLDACLVPPGDHASSPMSPFGGILSMLPSFLPSVHPSVAGGGIVPSIGGLSSIFPGLPGSYAPPASPIQSFQRDHGISPSGAVSSQTADSLRSSHGT